MVHANQVLKLIIEQEKKVVIRVNGSLLVIGSLIALVALAALIVLSLQPS